MLNPPGAKTPLLTGGTTTGSTAAVNAPGSGRTYHATALASSGTGNAVIAIQGTFDGTNFDTIGTITLTSASTAGLSDGFTSVDRYPRVRANVTSLSSNVTAAAWLGY